MATKQSKKESRILNPEFFPTWRPTTILLQAAAITALLTRGVFTGPRIDLNEYCVQGKRQIFAGQEKFLNCVKISDNLVEIFLTTEKV
jgi:hypothetical protein